MRYKVGDKIIGRCTRNVRVVTSTDYMKGIYNCDGWTIRENEVDHEATAKLTLPQPSKDMLRSGMKVIDKCHTSGHVLLECQTIFYGEPETIHDDWDWLRLNQFDENLNSTEGFAQFAIMQIWDGDTLIAQRTEKSEAELKKESLEKQISECSDKIKNLYVCIENLELEIKSL